MSNDGGPYKGQRERGIDYFDDIMSDNSIPAIFDTDLGGGGMRDYEKVSSQPNQSGVTVHMHCRACPSPAEIHIDWTELFMVAMAPRSQMLPQGWRRSEVNQAAYPDLRCNCGATCAPIITPDWAQKQVDAALRGGLVTPQQLAADPQVRQVQAILAQHAARAQGG
jgi:hypothetical protein